jgi:nucleotide-binding universal stress UspA family protein
MFKHILVPLDGSRLAEAALPVVVSLAEALNAPVTLMHVIEQDAPSEVHNERHLTNPSEAQDYLDEISKMAFPPEVKVTTHIHTAPVADVPQSIIDHASQEFQPDLIVLTSHGKSGIRNLLVGSIAQLVAAIGGTPVLLIKPEHVSTPFIIKNILVPLDNESVHDLALPYAVTLARAYHAQIDLLCVIPTLGTDSGEHAAAGSLLPATAMAYLDIAEEIAQEHFQEHLDEFSKSGLPASAEIVRGDPAAMIAETAEHKGSDLILMGTHGRAGMDAFWNRSVTAGVAKRIDTPLLLVPLPD